MFPCQAGIGEEAEMGTGRGLQALGEGNREGRSWGVGWKDEEAL